MRREPAAAPSGGVTLPEGEVYVDPTLDPARRGAVDAYKAGILARRGGLPKADLPLNPPRPPIPNLAGGPGEGSGGGGTMADYARAERNQAPAYAPAPTGSIIEEGAPPPPQTRQALPKLDLQPGDLLPPQAAQDPAYRPGPGSFVAVNQPHLAAKYGVQRGTQLIPPQQLTRGPAPGNGKPLLRPETIADLERLKALQDKPPAPGLDASEAEGRQAVVDGLGGSAARVGGVSQGDPVKPRGETDEERTKVLKAAIDHMDAFEFNQWRQLTMRKILHSEEERELIEGRLKALDIGELLTQGYIRQRIPIIPGKYEITLQTYDGQMELALKRLIMQEARSVDVGEQYLLDKHSFMSLAIGLHKVNDKTYPDILDNQGVFNDEMFFAKFNMVMRLPLHMLASIGVNQMWFEMRVRKLYSATAVGNG